MVAIRGHFDGKVIVPDEPVDLPRNQALIVRIETMPPTPEPANQSFFDWAIANPIDDPSLPEDLGSEHDHYLYGTPKRRG